MLRAVVFDFDGLILDTESAEFEAYQLMYRHHGAELPVHVWGQCVGTAGTFDPYAYLEEQLADRTYDRQAAQAMRRAHFESRMELADVRPGVREYLDTASRLGLRIGLASSSSRAWVVGYLERHGLLEAFEVIRTKEDVAIVKPDPELYLQAVQALGVEPHEAAAFEDSPNGALAAKRAGMKCVIVPNSVTSQLTFGEYDLQLQSMAEMGLEDVLARLVR
ncbi:HAD family hydrolase [Paenibacillus sp. YYML68]|uniref:HAD family hydrolase n=1 Tax=Paenibacillus sp. YYML68 TaxID=2909250 RepID=UPI00249279D4|nr:HAD family hydrolase [Paenibacillus sp. YYML68]